MTRTTIPENISGNELRTLKTNAISNGRLSNPYLNVFYGDSLACLQGILDGSGISVDPVSYTHLDVYKRQTLIFLASSSIVSAVQASPVSRPFFKPATWPGLSAA